MVAEKFTKAFLTIKISRTDRETMEETEEETISIDISCLLYPRNDVMVSKSIKTHLNQFFIVRVEI